MPEPHSNNPFTPPRSLVEDLPDVDDDSPILATRGARFAAALVDTLISFALYLAIMLPMYGFESLRSHGHSEPLRGTLVYYGLGFAVEAWFLYRSSQTLGKMALGLRIVRRDGGHASFGRSFWLRSVVASAVVFVPVIGLLTWVIDSLFIFGKSRRCVHDLLADTIVVTAASSQAAARAARAGA